MKDKMLAFMSEHKLCVISTVDPTNKPESALVAFSSNGLELLIGTSDKSRKFQNLLTNPSVAIVIADKSAEIQYEGQAHIVGFDESEEAADQHFATAPGADKYRNEPSQRYIRVTPYWIRFIEHGDVDQVEEWSEF